MIPFVAFSLRRAWQGFWRNALMSLAATLTIYASIVLTSVITYFVLSAASMVEKRLGQTGMRILTRLMGLVLCAIAIQFIVDGIKLSFR